MSIVIVHKANLSRRRHLARARDYARRHGERLLLLMSNPSWEADFVDAIIEADTADVDASVAAVQNFVAGEAEPVSGVVTFSEFCVPTVARIAGVYGVPALSEKTAAAARDKYAMRSAVAADGRTAQPRFGLARTADEALEHTSNFGYPAIIKPLIGCHSMYVQRVDNDAELQQHFDPIQRGCWEGFAFDPLCESTKQQYEGAVLVEEFVSGPEISVESVVDGGRTHCIAIHDKPLPTSSTFEEVYACTPTALPADVVEAVYRATADVHEALRIETGPTHVEFRLRDGREPVLLEAAGRMGGGPIYRSVLHSTGVDMIEAFFDTATGRSPVITPRAEPKPVGFRNIFPAQAGILAEVRGQHEAETDDEVLELEIFRALGEHIGVPPNTYEGHGHVIFTARDHGGLEGTFRRLVANLSLETRD